MLTVISTHLSYERRRLPKIVDEQMREATR
jgi:hypothetical protein